MIDDIDAILIDREYATQIADLIQEASAYDSLMRTKQRQIRRLKKEAGWVVYQVVWPDKMTYWLNESKARAHVENVSPNGLWVGGDRWLGDGPNGETVALASINEMYCDSKLEAETYVKQKNRGQGNG